MKTIIKFSLTLSTFAIALFFGIIILSSCGGSAEKRENKDSLNSVQADSNKTDIKGIDYPVSSPLEMTKLLNNAGASYVLLSNPVKSIDKYMTEKKKAINLGVYGADLGYESTYNKTQETNQYLNNVKKLSEDLGISNVFDKKLLEKVEKYINSKDTLYNLFTSSFEKTYNQLQENGKGPVSALVLAGGWVEALYISSKLAITSEKNEAIVKIVAEQKINLDKLMVAMKSYEDDPSVKGVIELLGKVKAVYDKTNVGKLDSKQLDALAVAIDEVRTKLIE